ncbi:hypothetical protein V6N11_034788, partial [Hibiscus sabdariffa]
MADYSGVVSLTQAPTAGDDSSEHTLMRITTLPTSEGGGGGPSKSNPAIYHQQHLIAPSASENFTRKPRGRPPGSKNKPRPSLVITKDSDSAMKTVVLAISPGCDIIETITDFARRNHVGVTIISATGSVSDVTLQNHVYHEPPRSLRGPFGLLSLSGSFIASIRTPQSSLACSFGVTLVGAQGQVFGGMVAGKITVATDATVVAFTFINPSFHRLPIEAVDNEDRHQETRIGSIHGNNGGGSGFVGGVTETCSFTGTHHQETRLGSIHGNNGGGSGFVGGHQETTPGSIHGNNAGGSGFVGGATKPCSFIGIRHQETKSGSIHGNNGRGSGFVGGHQETRPSSIHGNNAGGSGFVGSTTEPSSFTGIRHQEIRPASIHGNNGG